MELRRTAVETARLDEELTAGWIVVSATVGQAGEAVALMTPEGDADLPAGREVDSSGASFPLTRTRRPWRARLVVIAGGSRRVVEIEGLSLTFPVIQPLPDGGVVIAGGRCRLFQDGTAERNAVVVGPDGSLLSELTLGDGIQDLQASSDGSLWVSYFDEGVCGNFGWGRGEASTPLGASGLVRFDSDGSVLWEFRPPVPDAVIDDCYALNVDGETVWAYYYAEFPLARIVGEQVRLWRTGLSGARAVAIAGDRVLFAGGYGQLAGRVMVGRLGEDRVEDLVPAIVEVPGGGSWTSMRAVGRGGTLHLFGGGRWYAVDLAADRRDPDAPPRGTPQAPFRGGPRG